MKRPVCSREDSLNVEETSDTLESSHNTIITNK